MVLITEVCYYKKKSKKENLVSDSKTTMFEKTVAPFDNFEHTGKMLKSSVLLGPGNFTPAGDKRPRLSLISVYPRD